MIGAMFLGALACLTREMRAVSRAPLTFSAGVLITAALISCVAVGIFPGEANLLRQQLAEYRDKLHGASPAQAKAALEALANEVTALEAQLKPRRVDSHQREVITQHSQVPNDALYAMTIVYEGGCWDCPQFAADLDEAFRSVPGWSVSHRVMMGLAQRPARGLAVVLGDPARPSPQEQILLAALQAAGIAFDVQAARSAHEPAPQLLLAAKPAQ